MIIKMNVNDIPNNKRYSISERISTFLDKTGFVDVLSDDIKFQKWINELTSTEFEKILLSLNGIIRELPIKNRRFDGNDVMVGNEYLGVGYLPPREEDKKKLMDFVFKRMKILPRKDVGLLIYFALQAIHPFNDANGRTGRLIYLLLENNINKTVHLNQYLKDFIEHENKLSEGRELFTDKIISPVETYRIIGYILAEELLCPEIIDNIDRLFLELQSGMVEEFVNENITPETKKNLKNTFSEAGIGEFQFRDIVIAKFLIQKKWAGKYGKKEVENKFFRIYGEKLLEEISEEEAKELIDLFWELKKYFVEKLIDIIVEPEKYKTDSGKTFKDYLYK